MRRPTDQPITPIYLKTQAEMAWPDDTFFYLMTADGLFACRNHKFFHSCVSVRKWPSELARQEPFLEVAYPKLSRRTMERIVGFFSQVAELHGSEAGVLLAWDEPEERIHVVVPHQLASVSRNLWGDVFPLDLKYEVPSDLPRHWLVIGDVHSHVDYCATPSYVDDLDETHRAGLHVIVGRISSEPPEFHIEAVVDGRRFVVPSHQVMEGYHQRRTDIPQAWLDKVKIDIRGYHQHKCSASDQSAAGSTHESHGHVGGNGSGDSSPKPLSFCSEPDGHDDPATDTADVTLPQLPEPDQYPHADPEAPQEEQQDDRS